MPTGARISFGVYDETAKDEASYYAASGSAQSWVDYSEIKDGLSPDEDPDEFGRYIGGTWCIPPGWVVLAVPGHAGGLPPGGIGLHPCPGQTGCTQRPLCCPVGLRRSIPLLGSPSTSTAPPTCPHSRCGGYITGASNPLWTWPGTPCKTVFVENHVEGFNGLQIIATLTDEPYRYVKIQEIDFGQKVVYDGETLVSASAIEEADLSGGSVRPTPCALR